MKDFIQFIIVLTFSILGVILVLAEMENFELLPFIFIKIFGFASLLCAILLSRYFRYYE
jgi:hypothetical protein